MDKRYLPLGIIVMLIIASESAILPFPTLKIPTEQPFESDEILAGEAVDSFGKGKNAPGFPEPSDFDEFDLRVNDPRDRPSDFDYKKPEDSDDFDYNNPRIKPEIVTVDVDHDERPVRKPMDDDEEKENDEDLDKPIDEKEAEFDSEEKPDEKKPVDEDEEKPVDGDEEKTVEEDGEKAINEDRDKPEDEDISVSGGDEDGKPVDDEEEKSVEESGNAEPFHGGFMFDTPFFNMRQVSKYFQQLERALEHVFRQTLEEAALLNGTYANTTEEEIEIHGKKYLVQKSIITGKDNHSSIYIEALSSEPKGNETKEEKDSGL